VGLATSLALAFSSTTTKTCFTGDFGVGEAAAEAGTPVAPTPMTLTAAIAAAHHRRVPTGQSFRREWSPDGSARRRADHAQLQARAEVLSRVRGFVTAR
jgi:hypothetical protein